MATKGANNNEVFAHVFVGAITATAAAAVLSVPFYGFGPVLAYSAGVLAAGVTVRMLSDMLKENQSRDEHKRNK